MTANITIGTDEESDATVIMSDIAEALASIVTPIQQRWVELNETQCALVIRATAGVELDRDAVRRRVRVIVDEHGAGPSEMFGVTLFVPDWER